MRYKTGATRSQRRAINPPVKPTPKPEKPRTPPPTRCAPVLSLYPRVSVLDGWCVDA